MIIWILWIFDIGHTHTHISSSFSSHIMCIIKSFLLQNTHLGRRLEENFIFRLLCRNRTYSCKRNYITVSLLHILFVVIIMYAKHKKYEVSLFSPACKYTLGSAFRHPIKHCLESQQGSGWARPRKAIKFDSCLKLSHKLCCINISFTIHPLSLTRLLARASLSAASRSLVR